MSRLNGCPMPLKPSAHAGVFRHRIENREQGISRTAGRRSQWMAIQGFKQYGNDSLEIEIAWSWLHTVNHYYKPIIS